jgi:hypothetical protein
MGIEVYIYRYSLSDGCLGMCICVGLALCGLSLGSLIVFLLLAFLWFRFFVVSNVKTYTLSELLARVTPQTQTALVQVFCAHLRPLEAVLIHTSLLVSN